MGKRIRIAAIFLAIMTVIGNAAYDVYKQHETNRVTNELSNQATFIIYADTDKCLMSR